MFLKRGQKNVLLTERREDRHTGGSRIQAGEIRVDEQQPRLDVMDDR